MSWDESDHSVNGTHPQVDGDDQLHELGNNAVHYTIERTVSAEDIDSWEGITVLNIVREYLSEDCTGKEEIIGNYVDECEDPTQSQASDDGEWYYTGRGSDNKFHFLDEGLEANTTYHYRIFAINSHGRSSGIGNVLTHSTEAKPSVSFDRDMSAEIYAVGNSTNTLTASFSAANTNSNGNSGGGHNVSSASSSYTTYEGSTYALR